MTLEEYKLQLETLWDDFNIAARSYYFANSTEHKTAFWDMRNTQREKIEKFIQVYWSASNKPALPIKTLPDKKPVAISTTANTNVVVSKPELQKKRNIYITAFGKTDTLRNWESSSGINRQTIYYRIYKLGWSPEQAVSTDLFCDPKPHPVAPGSPLKTRNYREMTAHGKTKTLVQWSKESGIGRATLYSRVYQLNWKPEDALKVPVRLPKAKRGFLPSLRKP